MNKRLELHEKLCAILGSRNVYFQPPETVKMNYPAIVYSRSKIVNTFADNGVYTQSDSYEVIVIDKNPDSEIVREISKISKCTFDRHYASDNLNHTSFTLYY